MAQIGSWTADLQTGIYHSSLEGSSVIGWKPGVHNMDEWLDIVHPEDLAYRQAAWQAALQGAPYDIEHRIILDGDVRWLHIKAEIEFAPDGTPLKAVGVTQDITERKRSEEALLASQEKYQLLFETISKGVVFQAADGQVR